MGTMIGPVHVSCLASLGALRALGPLGYFLTRSLSNAGIFRLLVLSALRTWCHIYVSTLEQ
jgi:hypothetical protein